MIYGSLQAEFVDTQYNGHIHRYWTPSFGNIVVYLSKPLYNGNQKVWRLYNMIWFSMPSVLFTSNEGLF